MKYDDWKDAHETMDSQRDFVRKLSNENFAALDIGTQIKNAELKIKWETKKLERLKKAAAKLPTPPERDIYTQIIEDARYRWRGKREIEAKLYSYE